MNSEVIIVSSFKREAKRLAKRHKSLKSDIANLIAQLRENPFLGVDIGYNLRKIRMAITSKGKGKSGGARVITFVILVKNDDYSVVLLTLYDKSERNNISDNELLELLKSNGLT